MNISRIAATVLALSSPLLAQEGWSETRFHRVHLRNGNFIDGALVKETGRDVTLQLKVGTIAVRLDQIARGEDGQLRVELIKLKSFNEKPPVVPVKVQPARPPDPRKTPAVPPTSVKTPPGVPAFQPAGTTKEKVDQILQQIRKTDSDQRYQTAQLLKGAGEGWGPYTASLMEGLDDSTRTLAANVLRSEKDPDLLPIMRKLLSSEQPAVRAVAVSHLAEAGDASVAGSLRGMLRDSDAIVRGAAIAGLERLGDADSFDAIGALATDPDAAVRGRALTAARAIAERHELKDRMESLLESALSSASGDAKGDVLDAFGRLGRKDVWNKVTPSLREDNPRLRIRALSSLAAINAPESLDPILELLATERDPEVLSQATLALRVMRSTRAIGPLIELMSTTQELTLRSSCSRALREITGQNLGINPEKWQEWYKNQPK